MAVEEQPDDVLVADYAIPQGPAVLFDPAAAHTWLAEVLRGDGDHAEAYNIDPHGTFNAVHNSPADWLRRLLGDLSTKSAAPHVWRTAPGVIVEAFETVGDDEYPEHCAVLVVQVGGLRLASRLLQWFDRVTDPADRDGNPTQPQIYAAVQALGNAARMVNEMVEGHRIVRAADATEAGQPLSGFVTLVAVLRVPDDYDLQEDALTGYERALAYAESSPFAVVQPGVTAEARNLGVPDYFLTAETPAAET